MIEHLSAGTIGVALLQIAGSALIIYYLATSSRGSDKIELERDRFAGECKKMRDERDHWKRRYQAERALNDAWAKTPRNTGDDNFERND